MRTIELSRDEGEMIVELLEGDWTNHDPARMDGRLIEVASTIREKFGMCTREQSKRLKNANQQRRPS